MSYAWIGASLMALGALGIVFAFGVMVGRAVPTARDRAAGVHMRGQQKPLQWWEQQPPPPPRKSIEPDVIERGL